MTEPTQEEVDDLFTKPRQLAERWREAFVDMQAAAAEANAKISVLTELLRTVQEDREHIAGTLTYIGSESGSEALIEAVEREAKYGKFGNADRYDVARAMAQVIDERERLQRVRRG